MWDRKYRSYVAVFYETWYDTIRKKKFYFDEYEQKRAMKHLPLSRRFLRKINKVRNPIGVETRIIWG